MRRDQKTGRMAQALDPKTNKPIPTNRWTARFMRHTGKRGRVILAYRGNSRVDAQKEGDLLEAREREMAAGLRPIPGPKGDAVNHEFGDTVEEYLSWGIAQGGKGGRPWSVNHARDKRTHLHRWKEKLGLSCMEDLKGCLPKVEKALRELVSCGWKANNAPVIVGDGSTTHGGPVTGKTANEYAGSLKSFCGWAAAPSRGYLPNNPLDGIKPFDATPKVQRRAESAGVICALLAAAPPALRLLFEVAVCSGLRKRALRSLTPAHFDPERMTLRVDPKFDKANKLRYQRIPEHLRQPLLDFIASGEAKRLYAQSYKGRTGCTMEIPEEPLLFMPTHAARALARIAKRAGIPLRTEEGELVFHALRTTYINWVNEEGGDHHMTQELAGHRPGSPVTSESYLKTRAERLAATVEAVGAKLVPMSGGQSVADQLTGGDKMKVASPDINETCDNKHMVEDTGVEPVASRLPALRSTN